MTTETSTKVIGKMTRQTAMVNIVRKTEPFSKVIGKTINSMERVWKSGETQLSMKETMWKERSKAMAS